MNYYLTNSVGRGKTEITSFDDALFYSGISNYNLVKISSILPAYSKEKSIVDLKQGNILHTAFTSKCTHKKGELISSAIAVGLPINKNNIGVIMEFSGNCNKETAKEIVKKMVIEAMDKRGYEIDEIQYQISESVGNGKDYITTFAALAIWK